MKGLYKMLRAKSSGQLLLVAALVIAILITSTSVYVYELTGEKQAAEDSLIGEFALALKTGLRNTVISALANASNGGEKTVLAKNMETFSSAYGRLYKQGLCQISYTFLSGSGYEGGIKLSWNTRGQGISSAYVSFTLKVFDLTSKITVNNEVNVTTAITISGYYTINDDETVKTVSLTCQVFNEEKPAQAKNITVYYEDSGVWVPVNSFSMNDWGNGTYTVSFTVATVSNVVHVSAHALDTRNIFVIANATCNQA